MPIVRFPRFKTSLRLARQKAAELHGDRLARAIARLEDPHRDLVTDIVARLDPSPEGYGPQVDPSPEGYGPQGDPAPDSQADPESSDPSAEASAKAEASREGAPPDPEAPDPP